MDIPGDLRTQLAAMQARPPLTYHEALSRVVDSIIVARSFGVDVTSEVEWMRENAPEWIVQRLDHSLELVPR